MKIKFLLATLALTSSFSVFADSHDIYCLSTSCDVMSDEQLIKIDRVIDEQLRENITNKNFSGMTKSLVILNRDSAIDHVNIASMTKTKERDYLGLSRVDKPELVELEQSDTFMSFRVSPLEDRHTYVAANVYLEKDPLRQNDNDPNAYHVRMNTIGFGRQLREGWTVEIGLVKTLKAKAGIDKFNPAPDGFMLTFKKQL
jgi:hypothetical protein